MIRHRKRVRHIRTWRQFSRLVRSKGCGLLRRLDEFPNSILITGCQRSGTTMLSRIITQSEGMVNYWFGPDDELAAALILSGYVDHTPRGRYCFQTTYLNECYHEYFEHKMGHKIIWVLRNPFSVVHSILFNWRMFASNELFRGCGTYLLSDKEKRRYNLLGVWGISKLRRACLSFNGKVSQAFELNDRIGKYQMLVVDYDDLVEQKQRILPLIYRFIDLPYRDEYCHKIHPKSINKASRLSKHEYALIKELCSPVYDRARTLLSNF